MNDDHFQQQLTRLNQSFLNRLQQKCYKEPSTIISKGHQMLNAIVKVVFFPGDVAIRLLGLNMETDAGIFRTMINTCFWGAIALVIVANTITI